MRSEIDRQPPLSQDIQMFRHYRGSERASYPLNLFRKGRFPSEISSSLDDDKGSREDGVIRLGHLLDESDEQMKRLAGQSLEYISQTDASKDVRVAALRTLRILDERDNIDRKILEVEFPENNFFKHIPEFLIVPAGDFIMGCDNPSLPSEEAPEHVLYLPEYRISRTQITNLQYIYFVISTGYKTPYHWTELQKLISIGDHPVVNISWYDAMAYCNWVTDRLRDVGAIKLGQVVRLPSEAEWEKAARGDVGLKYPWGNTFDSDLCNFTDTNIENTTPVEKYSHVASPYGCLDLVGNTWEWTISLWGTSLNKCQFIYPYNPNDGRENIHTDEKYRRIIRGGGYYYGAECVTSYTRNHFRPNIYHTAGGFRVALIESKP